MEFDELLKQRYSVRSFSKRPVEQDVLQAVLKAGSLAPTGKNNQPQRILVVNSEEGLKKMRGCTPCHFNAPVVLIVCFDKTVQAFNSLSESKVGCGVLDASIAMTYMMLKCTDLGLGSVWVGMLKEDKLRQEFNIPQNYEIVSLLPLGYKGENAEPSSRHFERFSLEHTVSFEKF